jgi:hypothetical protein
MNRVYFAKQLQSAGTCNVDVYVSCEVWANVLKAISMYLRLLKQKEKERERKWQTLHFEGAKSRIYISGVVGSQAVPSCPSGRGNA